MLEKLDNRLKVIAGAVLLFSVYWVYQTFGTATLAITSEPVGAVVSVDGRQRGVTPIERLELDAGTRRVVIEHSHYAPTIYTLNMRRGDHEQLHAVMQAGSGTLTLLSNPRGAWVEVDGQRLAEPTPTTLQTASGPHVVRMGQAERHVVEETHTLNHDQTLEVNIDLNIDPHGTVTITTVPRNAKVEFLEQPDASSPKARMRIGEYAVRVSSPGYKTQEFRYQVRYGDNLHNVTLQRDYGRLVVASQPTGAEITVIYADAGKTFRKPYSQPLNVPVGPVEVRARSLGYRTVHKKIGLGPKGATVRFDLQRISIQPGSEIVDRLKVGGQAPVMVVVPAGSFVMGNNQGSYSEKPERTVTLTQPFAVSQQEVSIGEYLLYAQAQGVTVSPKVDQTTPDVSMAHVSFVEASRYTDWLSRQTGHKYRLLSESEWEYVARAGSRTAYFFGDDPNQLCTYANVSDQATRQQFRDWDVLPCNDGMVRVGPGGTYQPNPFGLYDIYGNVAEWVLDCGILSYEGSPVDGSPALEGEGCSSHGIRGGSWDSMGLEATSAYRNTASSANDDRGIRLLREL